MSRVRRFSSRLAEKSCINSRNWRWISHDRIHHHCMFHNFSFENDAGGAGETISFSN